MLQRCVQALGVGKESRGSASTWLESKCPSGAQVKGSAGDHARLPRTEAISAQSVIFCLMY